MKTIKEYILDLDKRLKDMEDAYNDIKDKIDEIKNIVTDLKNLEFGNWQIKDNQMIFFDLDGNELAKYNLYDKAGNPNDTYVFKREKQ